MENLCAAQPKGCRRHRRRRRRRQHRHRPYTAADLEKLRAAGCVWNGQIDDNTISERYLDSFVSNKMRLMLFVVNNFPLFVSRFASKIPHYSGMKANESSNYTVDVVCRTSFI